MKVGQARLEAELKGEIKVLDERLTGEIKVLDERLTGEIKTLEVKVDGVGKRLENQEFISRGIVIGLIVALVGGFAKLFGFIGKP